MKKLFFALIAVGFISTASAQSTVQRHQRDVYHHQYGDKRSEMLDKKRDEIAKVNNKYEKKINRIHRNPLMSPLVKLTRIQHLKKKQREELTRVNHKYDQWERPGYSRR
jgi:hypothetical protein